MYNATAEAAELPTAQIIELIAAVPASAKGSPRHEALTAEARRRLGSFGVSFPALSGEMVLQGHADYCVVFGHASHTVSHLDGSATVSPWCPRCGDIRDN